MPAFCDISKVPSDPSWHRALAAALILAGKRVGSGFLKSTVIEQADGFILQLKVPGYPSFSASSWITICLPATRVCFCSLRASVIAGMNLLLPLPENVYVMSFTWKKALNSLAI